MKRKPETEIIRSSRSVINWISQRFDGNTHNAVNQANRSLKNILKQIPQSNEATQKL